MSAFSEVEWSIEDLKSTEIYASEILSPIQYRNLHAPLKKNPAEELLSVLLEKSQNITPTDKKTSKVCKEGR